MQNNPRSDICQPLLDRDVFATLSPDVQQKLKDSTETVVFTIFMGVADSKYSINMLSSINQSDHLQAYLLVDSGTLRLFEIDDAGLYRGWTPVEFPVLFPTDHRRSSKVAKLLPHLFAPNAKYYIWMDAKLMFRNSSSTGDQLMAILDRELITPDYDWAMAAHPARVNIADEANVLKGFFPEERGRIDAQMRMYIRRNYDISNRRAPKFAVNSRSHLPDSCFFVRKNTPLTAELGCLWWNEIANLDYFARDQLSFGYVASKMHSQRPQFEISFYSFNVISKTFSIFHPQASEKKLSDIRKQTMKLEVQNAAVREQ